ncbi:MAG: hypothetical protein OEX01_06935 [Candidatus Bathyarchaeota archaeon]|nr:hypothetical protein [Candidatus Bathyarchaeota archaeon]
MTFKVVFLAHTPDAKPEKHKKDLPNRKDVIIEALISRYADTMLVILNLTNAEKTTNQRAHKHLKANQSM